MLLNNRPKPDENKLPRRSIPDQDRLRAMLIVPQATRRKNRVKRNFSSISDSMEGTEKISSASPKRPISCSLSSSRILLPKLNAGSELKSRTECYEIISDIGSGGFSQVYKARKKGTDEVYAIKTENVGERHARLQYEVVIMGTLARLENESHKKHFINLIDKGLTELCRFIVLEFVGPTIAELRKTVCITFSKSTAIRISQQTLQAIWDIHFAGFIHRDVKPRNFAIGVKPKDDIIYIFDFGIARKYTMKRSKNIRPQRKFVRFIGTVRYASRNSLNCKEQSRKDDLESWLYMCYELYNQEALSWRRQVDRRKILMLKKAFFKNLPPKMFREVPIQHKKIIKIVDKLAYETEPNYAQIQAVLNSIIREEHIDVNVPFDWIGKY